MTTLFKSTSDEVTIIKKGRKELGFFFGIMGVLFQIIFIWGYWSFLDQTGPWAILWLTIINSEFFPFTLILFVFGAGCILAAIREFGWQESLIIKKDLFQEIPGIQKGQKLFWWVHTTEIFNNQIITLRLHSILLDHYGLNKTYRIEVEYREQSGSQIETITILKEHEDKISISALSLVKKIHEILSLTEEIEVTESSTFQLEGGKKRGKRE